MNKNNRPQILLTNDDSIDSPGIRAAAEALCDLGFVHVVAPRVQQTSMGRALPRESDNIRDTRELEVKDQKWLVHAIGGSPAQSVLHGLLGVMADIKPDLVVSGINYGENVASGITISGTVGAALEAASFGIPALAVSLQTPTTEHFSLSDQVDFSTAAWFTHFFAEKMLRLKMPFDVDVLKVDIPSEATPETPWVVSRQSRTRYFEVARVHDPETGKEKIGYEARVDRAKVEDNSDLKVVLLDHKVSVTPISLDLTSRIDFEPFRKLLES